MKLEEYQTLALDTLNPDLVEKEVLAMCGLGLTGESGEVADILKKYLYHHKDGLGKVLLRDELGDVLWYVSVLASTLELTLEEIMQANIEKLHKRHSGGFTPHYVSDSVK